jgi:transposase InsO family protein
VLTTACPTAAGPSTGQARLELFGWLTFYNTGRYSALGYLSPIEYEQRSSMLAAAA